MASKTYSDRFGCLRIEWTPEDGPLAGKTLTDGLTQGDGTVFFKNHRLPVVAADYPDLMPAAAELEARERDRKARSEEMRRESREQAAEFEKTEEGRRIRAEIEKGNAIEEAMRPDPSAPARRLPPSGPTDADIRSLEGNEDL